MTNNYKILGKDVEILCARGKRVLIDQQALVLMSKFGRVSISGEESRPYATIWNGEKNQLLHRIIAEASQGVIVDHLDGNGLNNTKRNLRITTKSGNSIRRDKQLASNNKSGFRGVYFYKRDKKWIAQTKIFGKPKYLGRFDTPLEASFAFEKAMRNHPEYCESSNLPNYELKENV
jgi:hypothetical protein